MPGDGTPDESTKRLGEEIARLRTRRGLTRLALSVRATHSLELTNPLTETIGENWLARLETGRMARVSHEAIEVLCKALNCTPSERAAIFMHANRNPLADSNGNITPEAQLLGQIMVHLYKKPEILEALQRINSNPKYSREDLNKLAEELAESLEDNLAREQKATSRKPVAN